MIILQVDFSGEVINLTTTSLPERRTWSEIHADWEDREDRPRGKILLLYSPDTKLFKELQEALKSFLDLACHCDIYDLFDDALFDTIAMDPAGWLQEFVNDREVKIILISSIGRFYNTLVRIILILSNGILLFKKSFLYCKYKLRYGTDCRTSLGICSD